MKLFRRLMCFLRFHRWDGHVGPYYPAPRCIDCKKWHHRDIYNESRH